MKRFISVLLAVCLLCVCALSANALNVAGDIDGNYTISIKDASYIQKMVAGLYTPTADELEAADMNGDGSVDLLDVLVVLRYVARDSSTLNQYAYLREQRIALIELINADRAERGVDPLEYSDATLAIGQIRAQEVYDGYVDTRADGRNKKTIFSDYGLPANSCYEYYFGAAATAQAAYENILTYISEDEYENYLMSSSYTTICVGSIKRSNFINQWTIDIS